MLIIYIYIAIDHLVIISETVLEYGIQFNKF